MPFITSELKFQGKNVYKVGAGILPGFNFCMNLGSVPVDFDILCAPFYDCLGIWNLKLFPDPYGYATRGNTNLHPHGHNNLLLMHLH